MTAWLLVLTGAAMAGFGTAVSVGAGALSRLELTRWTFQRLRGAAAAGALLGTPRRVLATAGAVSATGSVLLALGAAAALDGIPAFLLGVLLVAAVVPATIAGTYVLPRALARRWPKAVVRTTVPWVDRLGRLLTPLMPSSYTAPPFEPGPLLSAGTEADLFERDELAVLSGLLAFIERPAREVMTDRTRVVAVAEGESLAQVARIVAESGYSRLPVYRETLDNIVGMVYAFDLLAPNPGPSLPVRPVYVAPASKPCADLLFEMQRDRRQFAVLLDEFGGTAGIVTLGDLLAALVTAVFGEREAASEGEAEAPALLEVDGATPAAELAARFATRLPGAAETVGGLLARLAGRIPRAGERFVVQNLELDVLAASPTRVDRVAVRPYPVPVTVLPKGEGT